MTDVKDLTLWIDDDGFLATGSGDSYLTVADTHMCDPTVVDTGLMDAWAERIRDCVNAMQGIDDPAAQVTMWKAHIAAQHDSLGKCADRIAALESALRRCEDLFRHALPKFNWGASFLDADAIRMLNEVPLHTSLVLSTK